MNIIEFIQQYISFPKQFEFILYLAAAVLMIVLFILTVDFFVSIFLAIFKRR